MTKIICCYALVYIVWGSTYFFIKLAVQTIPPEYVVGTRFFIGGLFLAVVAIMNGYFKQLPNRREVLGAMLIGFLLLFLGNGLVSIAQKRVDSYFAALIIAATPIPVLFYDTVFFRKKLLWTSVLGALTGIGGVGLLLSDGTARLPVFSSATILLLIAICFWGLGTSLSKVVPLPKNSMVTSAIQQVSVGIITLFGTLFFSPLHNLELQAISPVSVWAVVYLSIMGSITLAAYSYLLTMNRIPASLPMLL